MQCDELDFITRFRTQWLGFSWSCLYCAGVGIAWKRPNRTLLALFAAGAIAAAWWMARAGAMLVIDAPTISDTIIVLAGETDQRPALAEALLERGYARHVILDVPLNATIYNVVELNLARQYLQTLPRGQDWSVCPIQGLSTKDEVKEAAACAARLAPETQTILVVTSDFHTRRALSVARQEIRGPRISVAAARDPAQFGIRWWTHRQWAKVCLDEWLRLVWWMAVDRWR
jgi:uncharacterized SAM-binding protein YcdF (DUF218 family)